MPVNLFEIIIVSPPNLTKQELFPISYEYRRGNIKYYRHKKQQDGQIIDHPAGNIFQQNCLIINRRVRDRLCIYN